MMASHSEKQKQWRAKINPEIGERIYVLRRRKGISQLRLAEMIGIGRPAMNLIENGKSTLDVPKLLSICSALEIEPNSFFKEGE